MQSYSKIEINHANEKLNLSFKLEFNSKVKWQWKKTELLSCPKFWFNEKSQLLLFSQVVPVLALSCCCCLDSAAAAAKTAAPMGLDLALEAEPNPDNALDIKEEVVVEEELAAEDTAAAVVVLLAAVEVVAAAAAEAVNYTREYGLLILAHQKYRCWKQTITGIIAIL